jgi:SEFIR domain
MSDVLPKAFISYSWTSDEHGQWVIDLSTQLRESGIDVILDKWDLKDGHDVNVFMEQMETDREIRKVIIVCNRRYAERSDKREGGVGTETQIITPEIYAKAKQDKFVAVVTERDEDGKPYVPVYYKSRMHIDLGDPSTYATSFERLVRWVFNKPLYESGGRGAP